ncbi:hypothetical protein [Streptomyces sp. NPDC058745]|uniref:hypothetical protein n=1 Tax=Streptomyces sp. NPDC058745 TaxID=3346621 RepID=UPI0036A0EDE0
MPKNQSTAAKQARVAARAGAKYTAALRSAGGFRLPPGLALVDVETLPDGERMVVEGLRALAAEGRPLPLRETEPDPDVAAARVRAQEGGRRPVRCTCGRPMPAP